MVLFKALNFNFFIINIVAYNKFMPFKLCYFVLFHVRAYHQSQGDLYGLHTRGFSHVISFLFCSFVYSFQNVLRIETDYNT